MPDKVKLKGQLLCHPQEVCVKLQEHADYESREEMVEQHDTFFRCFEGRFKLRQTEVNRAVKKRELIQSKRDKTRGCIQYMSCPLDKHMRLTYMLYNALDIVGKVFKGRVTFSLKSGVRVHVDTVTRLGTFLQLETTLEPLETAQQAEARLQQLFSDLQLGEHQWKSQERDYVELLNEWERDYQAKQKQQTQDYVNLMEECATRLHLNKQVE